MSDKPLDESGGVRRGELASRFWGSSPGALRSEAIGDHLSPQDAPPHSRAKAAAAPVAAVPPDPEARSKDRVLVVDDEPPVCSLVRAHLRRLGYSVDTCNSAGEAMTKMERGATPAVVLSDVRMPDEDGVSLLRRIKRRDENIQVVMLTGLSELEVVRSCMRAGAYDYLTKPFDFQLLARTVERAVEKGRLLRQNEEYRGNLERLVLERTREIEETRDIALMTLAKLAESRDNETGVHLERIALYSRRLAEELRGGIYADIVSERFIEEVAKSSPLHDIGKVGIPDDILLKTGPLTPNEFRIMQRHTTIGGDTLRSVQGRNPSHGFLVMAMEIAYSHHEKWNGKGYPRGLAGDNIPLAARIVALADAYDTITSSRPYKEAYTHQEATYRVTIDRGKHFDPELVDAFLRCQRDFSKIKSRVQG